MAGHRAASNPLLAGVSSRATRAPARLATRATAAGSLPVNEIEQIIRAKGTVDHGVLNIRIDRDDIPHVTKDGEPVKPSLEINGNLCFETRSRKAAVLSAPRPPPRCRRRRRRTPPRR